MKERFVARRLIYAFLIFAVTVAFTLTVGWMHRQMPDELLGVLFVDAAYFALLFFMLEHERAAERLAGNKACSYRKIFLGYTLSALILLAGARFPEYVRPVLFLPFIMTGVGSVPLAMCTGIFLDSVLCLILGTSCEELICCCFLTMAGCMLAEAMMNRKNQPWCTGILFALSVLMPELFYYFTYQEVNIRLFFWGGAEGLAVSIFVMTFYRMMLKERAVEVPTILDDIVDASYPAARELGSFSRRELDHARKVSRLSGACAKLIGADEKLCAAAGFYYRIGIIEGEPIAESGVRIAQRYCFPEEIIQIIREYDGKQELPSTAESAIVHMVNGLLLKMEVLNGKTSLNSEWNQDMVIYQTLNEYSAAGLYDKSGISMNMFLKIREYLVKEEALL